jgi:hypothetical protein
VARRLSSNIVLARHSRPARDLQTKYFPIRRNANNVRLVTAQLWLRCSENRSPSSMRYPLWTTMRDLNGEAATRAVHLLHKRSKSTHLYGEPVEWAAELANVQSHTSRRGGILQAKSTMFLASGRSSEAVASRCLRF